MNTSPVPNFDYYNFVPQLSNVASDYINHKDRQRERNTILSLMRDPFLAEETEDPLPGRFDSWLVCRYENDHVATSKFQRELGEYYSKIDNFKKDHQGQPIVIDMERPKKITNVPTIWWDVYIHNTYAAKSDPFERNIIVEVYQYKDRIPDKPDVDDPTMEYRHWNFKLLDYDLEEALSKEQRDERGNGPKWTTKCLDVCERDMTLPYLFTIDAWCRWVGVQRPRKLLRYLGYKTNCHLSPRVACVIRVFIYKHVKECYEYTKERKDREEAFVKALEESNRSLKIIENLPEEQQLFFKTQKEELDRQIRANKELQSQYKKLRDSQTLKLDWLTSFNNENSEELVAKDREEDATPISTHDEKNREGSAIFDKLSGYTNTNRDKEIKISLDDIHGCVTAALGTELDQEYSADDEKVWELVRKQLEILHKSKLGVESSLFTLEKGEWKHYYETYFQRNGEGRFMSTRTGTVSALEEAYANLSDDELSKFAESRNKEMEPEFKKYMAKVTKAIENPTPDNIRAKVIDAFNQNGTIENMLGHPIGMKHAVTLDTTQPAIYARVNKTLKGFHSEGKLLREDPNITKMSKLTKLLIESDYGYEEYEHDHEIPDFDPETVGIKVVKPGENRNKIKQKKVDSDDEDSEPKKPKKKQKTQSASQPVESTPKKSSKKATKKIVSDDESPKKKSTKSTKSTKATKSTKKTTPNTTPSKRTPKKQ